MVNPICCSDTTHKPHHCPNVAASTGGRFQQHSGGISPWYCSHLHGRTEGLSDPKAFQGAVGKTITPVQSSGWPMSMDASKISMGGTSPISHQPQL